MVVRNNFICLYQTDRFPRARTLLSISLALPVIAMGFLLAWSLKGPLRYGPYLLGLVAISAAVARPCNHPMVVAFAGPMAMSNIGMLSVAITLPLYAALATVAAAWRRCFATPYGRAVWPDFPPGSIRQVALTATVACGIAWLAALVTVLRS